MGRLFWKFFLFFFIAQLTTALAVGAFIQFNADDRESKIRLDLSPVSQSLIEAAQSTLQFGGLAGLKQLLQRWEAQGLNHHVYVVDQNARDILDRSIPPNLIRKAKKSAKAFFNESVANVRIDGEPYLIFVASHRPSIRALRDSQRERGKDHHWERHDGEFAPRPPPKPNPLLRTISSFPIKALMIAAIASALFAAMLAWYFSKPIDGLRRAFKRAAEGDLQFSAASQMGTRKDELSDLGRHFDEMTKRLSALMQGQTRLLHHVSHELRSPLARMQMALGLAAQSPEKAASSLNRIELEAGRMDKLIGELLELSRFESGMVDLNKEPFSLNEMIATIVDDANFEASKKHIQIIAKMDANIVFQGQPDLIHRAVENVVRNAVKYGPNDSVVSVSIQLSQDNKKLDIVVKDQGLGVLENELEDVFKPFVRGNAGSQVDGHGVGLAITKQVIEAHGGQVVASNIKPRGFKVTMSFPDKAYSMTPET